MARFAGSPPFAILALSCFFPNTADAKPLQDVRLFPMIVRVHALDQLHRTLNACPPHFDRA
jgi:hypothetical protein